MGRCLLPCLMSNTVCACNKIVKRSRMSSREYFLKYLGTCTPIPTPVYSSFLLLPLFLLTFPASVVAPSFILRSKDLERCPHIREGMRCLSFWVWVTPRSIFLCSVHLPANLISSFFFTADQNCTAYTCSHFVIHPSTRRHLDYFHFISIVNTATDEEL